MKSEKEKMLAGEPYLANDPQLVEERRKARNLISKFNSLNHNEDEEKKNLLSEMLGKVGDYCEIEAPLFCDYGSNIYCGENLFINTGCVILDCNTVTFGDNVQIGPSVQIYTATHPTDPKVRLSGKESALPIKIGDNVWLGGGVILCPGVNIGNNSTIGAGSVVTKDIPDNVIAAGNPCKIINYI